MYYIVLSLIAKTWREQNEQSNTYQKNYNILSYHDILFNSVFR